MKKPNGLAGVALLSIGMIASSAASAATLGEAIQQTLKSNPDILITTNERLSRDQEIRQARSGYYPEINANLGYGREWTDNTVVDDVWLTRKEASLELRQMLFDGWATKSEVERQEARVDSSAHKVSEAAEKLALRTAEVYLELIKQRELLELAEGNLKAHQKIYDQIERRSTTGVSRRADLDQITGRLALAESNVIASRNNVNEAEANYLRVVGAKADTLERPALPADSIPATVEDAVEMSFANHPTLKSAQSDVDATIAQNKAAQHAYYPRFDLEVARTWNRNLDGVEGDNEDFTAMIRMRWNLFRGKHDEARDEQTAHLINEAKEVRHRAQRQAEEGVRLSWTSYQSTMDQRDFLKRHVDSSEATKTAYSKQFEIGQRTLLDLLDSENELFEAKKAFMNADYTNLFAQYRILNGMGKLTETLNAELPAEATPLAEAEEE